MPTKPIKIKCLDKREMYVLFVLYRTDSKVVITRAVSSVELDGDNDTGTVDRLFRNGCYRRKDGNTTAEDLDLGDPETKQFLQDAHEFARIYNPIEITETELLKVFEAFSRLENYKPGDLAKVCVDNGVILKR